jgi:hypothetical protein
MRQRAVSAKRGQILVFSALLMTLFFVPLAVLVIDTGLVEAGYAQLSETVQAAAEDGASTLNEDLYRSTGGTAVQLDAGKAQAVAGQALAISRLSAVGPWQVTVRGNVVTVTAHQRVHLFILGAATISTTRSARLAYGA